MFSLRNWPVWVTYITLFYCSNWASTAVFKKYKLVTINLTKTQTKYNNPFLTKSYYIAKFMTRDAIFKWFYSHVKTISLNIIQPVVHGQLCCCKICTYFTVSLKTICERDNLKHNLPKSLRSSNKSLVTLHKNVLL